MVHRPPATTLLQQAQRCLVEVDQESLGVWALLEGVLVRVVAGGHAQPGEQANLVVGTWSVTTLRQTTTQAKLIEHEHLHAVEHNGAQGGGVSIG